MAKSLLTQLKEALERGDLEQAKLITTKLASSRQRTQPEAPVVATPAASYLMPAQSKVERTQKYGRMVQVSGAGKVNHWTSDQVDPRIHKADQLLQQYTEIGETRAPMQKIEQACVDCQQTFAVYPSQLTVITEDDQKSRTVFRCDRCIRSRR